MPQRLCLDFQTPWADLGQTMSRTGRSLDLNHMCSSCLTHVSLDELLIRIFTFCLYKMMSQPCHTPAQQLVWVGMNQWEQKRAFPGRCKVNQKLDNGVQARPCSLTVRLVLAWDGTVLPHGKRQEIGTHVRDEDSPDYSQDMCTLETRRKKQQTPKHAVLWYQCMFSNHLKNLLTG